LPLAGYNMNDNGKVILKVLLFCLAFTALAGVISVMSSSNSLRSASSAD